MSRAGGVRDGDGDGGGGLARSLRGLDGRRLGWVAWGLGRLGVARSLGGLWVGWVSRSLGGGRVAGSLGGLVAVSGGGRGAWGLLSLGGWLDGSRSRDGVSRVGRRGARGVDGSRAAGGLSGVVAGSGRDEARDGGEDGDGGTHFD